MKAVPAVLTLVSDTDSLELRRANPHISDPIICTQYDLGSPTVRDSAADRPGGDGSIDRTMFTGSRAVTFDLTVLGDVWASPYAYLERLAAMTHPSIRPRLRLQRDTPEALGQTWEIELRGNPYSIAYGRSAAARLDLQMQFTAPLGYFVGDWQQATTQAASQSAGTGWSIPAAGKGFPWDFGNGAISTPVVKVDVGGSAPVTPVIYIYGPCAAPEVHDETGQRFRFNTGLALTAGQFVQIDMGAGTARLGGNPDASVYGYVDFSVSTFWQWRPGTHYLTYVTTDNFGYAVAQWRDRRFTV